MGNIIQIKRGSAEQVGTATLADGEMAIDITNQFLYYGYNGQHYKVKSQTEGTVEKAENLVGAANTIPYQSDSDTTSFLSMSNGFLTCNSNILSWTQTIPIEKGGSGATTAGNALKNFIGNAAIGEANKPLYWNGNTFVKIDKVAAANSADVATYDSQNNNIASTYLPLSGDKEITGYLQFPLTYNSSWNGQLNNSILRFTGNDDSQNSVAYLLSIKTRDASWGLGLYNGVSDYQNHLIWHYLPDNSEDNSPTPQIRFDHTYGIVCDNTGDTGMTHIKGEQCLRFGIGASGVNRGIYDEKLGSWMIYNGGSNQNSICTARGRIITTNSPNSNTMYMWWSGSSVKLQVDSTELTLLHSSDRRLKQDILTLPTIKDLYMDLNPVQFNFKKSSVYHTPGLQTGLIAQDIIDTFSKYNLNAEDYALIGKEVEPAEDEKPYLDTDWYYTLDYTSLHAYHIKFGQEIYTELSNRISVLESRIRELEAQI